MQSLHSAITPPAPPTPRQLSKSPTSRQVEKPTSRKVGKLANTAPFLFTLYPLSPPESRSAAKRPTLPPLRPLPLTPPVDLTRPNVPPLQHWSPPRIAAKRPTSTGAPARIVHTSSHPRPLAPRQLANFPTSRKADKLASWQTPPPSPAPPTRAGCIPPAPCRPPPLALPCCCP